MLFEGDGTDEFKLLEYKKLEILIGYCETSECRRKVLYLTSMNILNTVIIVIIASILQKLRIIQLRLDGYLMLLRTLAASGVSHIIDALRGSKNIKVTDRSHDQLDIFEKISKNKNRFFHHSYGILLRQKP